MRLLNLGRRSAGGLDELRRIWNPPRCPRFITVINNNYVGVVYVAAAFACLALAACGEGPPPALGGDPEHGRLLLRQFGCGTCHVIPGVAAARGTVGPPLEAIARRVYLAGRLPNTPENMARWIREPQAIAPGTAMPDMQVTEGHSRDMVAYLYTLK